MSEDKFFGIPIKTENPIPLVKHALCNLQEITSVDGGTALKATYCKDHGLLMVYDLTEESEPQNQRTAKG